MSLPPANVGSKQEVDLRYLSPFSPHPTPPFSFLFSEIKFSPVAGVMEDTQQRRSGGVREVDG